MITIFNGRRRTLGGGSSSVWAQVDVSFREHLAEFKGARLGVFLAIALHANEEGWAWPSYKMLEEETSYNEDTIIRALAHLCQLRINGQRVLLRYQLIRPDGTFDNNRYLIFPSEEEVRLYEQESPYPENAGTVEPSPYPENPCTENPRTNHNQSEQEPGEREETTIWRKALSLLALRMSRETFNHLFLPARLRTDSDHWMIEFPHESACQWAEARMADVVASILREAGAENRPIAFTARGMDNLPRPAVATPLAASVSGK
jgi:hypothetical protein